MGLGECQDGTENLVLLRLTLLYTSTEGRRSDFQVCLTGSNPSSFTADGSWPGGPPPGYSPCNGDVRPFGVAQNGAPFYIDGCLIINPSEVGRPIGADAIGFGPLKARF